MAGIATGLGTIQDVGYTSSKHGVVALTRSFATSKPNVELSEGVKCYAICPFFADTALVKESTNISDLERRIKGRVLTVTEVGHAFEKSLEIDTNGAAWVVYPDCPPFIMPDVGIDLCKLMILVGTKIAGPWSFDTFDYRLLMLSLIGVLFFIWMCYSILCFFL